MTCQAPGVPLGKGRAPATGRPFPFTPLPAGSQPARRPSEAVSPRAVPRQPPRASPRWPTCPQRRPGAGPRPGAGVASASGPAPPLAVPVPSRPACRARHSDPRVVPHMPPRFRSFGRPALPLQRHPLGWPSVEAKEVLPRAVPHLLMPRRLPRPCGIPSPGSESANGSPSLAPRLRPTRSSAAGSRATSGREQNLKCWPHHAATGGPRPPPRLSRLRLPTCHHPSRGGVLPPGEPAPFPGHTAGPRAHNLPAAPPT